MSWHLARESHAIERVAVAISFAEPIPSRRWLQLLSQAEKAIPENGFVVVSNGANRLPGPAPMDIRIIARMGDGPLGAEQLVEQIDLGRHFQRLSGNELQEEVILNRESFVYITPLYTRWNAFRTRVMELLKPSLDLALDLVPLQFAKLEYWDRFVFNGPIKDVDYRDLLKPNSKFVPGLPIDMKELWHSHVGFFAPPGDSQRRLVHLNVDVIDITDNKTSGDAQKPEQRRSVGIYSMAQDTLDLVNGAPTSDAVSAKLGNMHDALKDVLREVITKQAAEQINLDSGVVT
jgi:uncharacterized protein (TIGR04255 family)